MSYHYGETEDVVDLRQLGQVYRKVRDENQMSLRNFREIEDYCRYQHRPGNSFGSRCYFLLCEIRRAQRASGTG